MIYWVKTDASDIFWIHSRPERQYNIAPGWQARWRPRRAFRFPVFRDSKRVGKFAVDAGARREALDMYPRERRTCPPKLRLERRRKPADAAKSPARFERNAWRICPAMEPCSVITNKFVLHPL